MLRNCFPGETKKAVILSYDDGMTADRQLIEIMNRHGLRGTFHLNSGKLDDGDHVTAAEMPVLYRGHEVSCHTRDHFHFSQLAPSVIAEEILADRDCLKQIMGYPIRGMSYPYGEYNDRLLAALPGFGIEYARTTRSHGGFHFPENPLTWHPTCHHRDRLMERTHVFLEKETSGLLFVWGHSYEFEREGNWELMEEFGNLIGKREDVWYTTCIEIITYMRSPEG